MKEPHVVHLPIIGWANKEDPKFNQRLTEQSLLVTTIAFEFNKVAQELHPQFLQHLELTPETRPVCSPVFELKRDIIVRLAYLADWVKTNTPQENSPETARLYQEFQTLDQAMKMIQTVLAV
jgi:hypothetical protein